MGLFKKSMRFLCALLFFLPSACDSVGQGGAVSSDSYAPREVEVLDGDTVRIKGEKIRLLGVDSPEIGNPKVFRGSQDPHGKAAEEFMRKLVSSCTEIVIERAPTPDKYGRTLGYVIGDGKNLNAELVRAGHAWETISFYGNNQMPVRAAEVEAAWAEAGKPDFEKPHTWRKKNTIRK